MKYLLIQLILWTGVLFSSCTDYLNIVPKGEKIPTTLADFEALLRDEYTIGQTPVANALYLLNDRYLTVSNLNTPTLATANYMWDEQADRIILNNSSENTYYYLYMAIANCNLIIEHAPTATECTDQERAEVIAYAKVIRSVCYFTLVNFYADTYDKETASQTRGIPLITSANINAPHEQVSVQELYDFIINDIKEAISAGLPEKSMTVIHPNLGAAYAMLARIYLQMSDFEHALQYADKALEQNDRLFDWNAYYNQYKERIEDPDNYDNLPTPTDYTYIENYYFRCGDNSPNYSSSELDIPVERANRFEQGDARFLSRWKYRSVNQDTYYDGIGSGYFNWGGLTTCEVYLIKAECLARQAVNNDFSEAMQTLDAVRITRIRPEFYQPSAASTLQEAIRLIRRTKDNELIFSIVPFADARRFNREGEFVQPLSKTYQGKTYTLSPQSSMWTMPFPAGAINNPGNGTIEQNVSK